MPTTHIYRWYGCSTYIRCPLLCCFCLACFCSCWTRIWFL